MAAYAALVSLLNNIHTITNHPSLSTSLDNTNIQTILEKTGLLLDFIEGYKYGGGSKEAGDLERQIASAAHAAEDLLEFHIVDQIHAGTSETSIACSLDLQKGIQQMDAIIKRTEEVKEKLGLQEEQQPIHLAEPLIQSGETAMVGLDAELNQLLDMLTGYESSRRIISIVGMGGSGKTTLAKNVYENLLIVEQFQFRAWATISQQNNAKEILSKVFSSLGEFSGEKVDDLGKQLHKTLYGRRYLIILDDIWSVKAWDEVKNFFPDNRNGSRVLLTTRLSNVARDCGSSLFMLNLLDEVNAWKLFREKAFLNEDCPPNLCKVGKDIVKLCKGLALSIVVIGGLLLKSPRTEQYWRDVANHLKLIPNSKEKQESLDVLSLSYNHLPSHLKPCFLYLGVFKEDSEIRVSKMMKLWIAEGFIKPTGSRVLEEIAEGYIKDLIDRNLILAGRRRKNGKFGSCGIHDLLRDLCIKFAEQQDFFQVNKSQLQYTERRLVNCWPLEPKEVALPFARSILAGMYTKKLVQCRLLRVLDEVSFNLEEDFYENVNLRYLAYKRTHRLRGLRGLWKLPTSSSLLWNLQILIIKIPYGSLIVVAPIEFWKMRQLRHVQCSRISIPCPPPSNGQDALLTLEKLQSLQTIVNFRLCAAVCKIIPNIKKLYLVYDHDLMGYNDDGLMMSVRNFDSLPLTSLKLKIRSHIWPTPSLLTSLPSSLNKLCLSYCGLHWNDLQMIGSLPQLEVLKLEVLSVMEGANWSCVDGQFQRLKFLEVSSCRLVCWDADSSHFPVLEKLLLFNLWRLEEIPLSIGDIPTLELICVDFCSISAAISAVRIKEDQMDNDDQLQVQVWMLETQLRSFNQMLEKEELTTDNIQFQI